MAKKNPALLGPSRPKKGGENGPLGEKKKMGGRCAYDACPRAAFAKSHWLCAAHRRERGLVFLSDAPEAEVTAGEVLGALVFSLPETCASADHFLGRFYAATRCWRSRRPCYHVLKQHALLGRVRVRRGVTRDEMSEFASRLARFAMRGLAFLRLVDVCADRVAKFFVSWKWDAIAPLRAMSTARARLAPSSHIVLSDAVLALRAVLATDTIRSVFAHYTRLRRAPTVKFRVSPRLA